MSETSPEPTTEPAPAAAAPTSEPVAAPKPSEPPTRRSLEDSLGGLDEETRNFVLGEVRSARSQAADARVRLKEAEPKLSEYDALVEASKSDLEKAQEAARKATETATASLQRVAAAELRAALTGLVPEPGVVVDDLNIAKFLTVDGEIDAAAVEGLRQRFAQIAPEATRMPRPNPAQGSSANGAAAPAQLTRQDIERLAAEGRQEEILKAKAEGRLNDALGIKP